MTRRTLGVAGLVSALLVGLLGIGATSAAADLEDDEVIAKGRVVFNGEPVEKAEVRLVSRDGRSGGAATTDRRGAWVVTWVEPGEWTAYVNSYYFDWNTEEGFTHPFLSTYVGDTMRLPEATFFTLEGGTATTMDIDAVAGASIKGKVVNSKKKGVAGVTVTASNYHRAGTASTTTDSKGNYVLHGLATGTVAVAASTSESASRTTKVKATQGKTAKAKNLTLRTVAKGTITATVKGLKKGDKVYAYNTKSKETVRLTTARKSGTVKLKRKISPGAYRVVIGGQNIGSKVVTVKTNKTSRSVTLEAAKARTAVWGTIKTPDGEALAGADVLVLDRYGTKAGDAVSGSNGRYSITGVVNGKYTARATDPSGTYAATQAKVRVTKGEDAKRSLRLNRTYLVTGTVSSGAEPVAGVTVWAGEGSAVTDAQGAFTFNVAGGEQRFRAHDPYPGGYLNAVKTLSVGEGTTWNPRLKG